MRFCTSCNQERAGDNRFCTTCGTELTDAASGPALTETFTIARPQPDEPAADRPYQQTQLSLPSTPAAPSSPSSPKSQADRAYQETQIGGWDPPPTWGQPASLPPQADEYPQPGQYAPYSGPGQFEQPPSPQPGYPPPGYPQPGYPGAAFPAFPAPGPRAARQGRTVALIAGAAVVVLAAGGGAFALVSSLHHGKSGLAAAKSSALVSSTSPATTPTTAPATPTPTPTTASPTPTPTPTPTGPVDLAAGVASSPYAAQLETTFTHYFDGINTRSYAEYASSLDATMQADNSQSSFDSGYATTTDSGERISSITGSGANLTAVVTFTSMQAASDSPDGSACNHYTLTLPLVQQGSGYVIATPPSGYAAYSDC